VRQSGGRLREGKNANTWVAISRPPYFTALALWFVGGTYHTGGFFPDCSHVWTGYGETGPDQGSVPPWLAITPPKDIPYIDGTPEWTDRTVHFNRLLRDGWVQEEDATFRTRWRLDSAREPASLVMTQELARSGHYVLDYRLRRPGGHETQL